MKIIGICGKKGVGKNFVAELAKGIIEKYDLKDDHYSCDQGHYGGSIRVQKRVDLIAFAEPLKEFLIACLGLQREWVYGSDKDKNNPTTIPWDNMPQVVRGNYPNKSGLMTHREVMQVFGTDVMRDMWDKNIWVNTMRRRLKNSTADYNLITDVRFPNEVDSIREQGAKIWLVDGPQRGDDAVKNDKHSSEMLHACDIKYDVVIRNEHDTTLDDLKAQIRNGLGI
jgi:hypothetical protein